jgi:hypothetical protein
MHLLITSSEDVTSDLICERLAEKVLRLNWERWNEYAVDVCNSGFQISDRFGRRVDESTIANIIWRKPAATVDTEPGEFWYCFQEFKYAIKSIMERVRLGNPRKLPIDPAHNDKSDKFAQLQVASRHLVVPEWVFTSSPSRKEWGNDAWVVKSVTGKPIPGTGDFSKVIYTNAVDPSSLSDNFPWFLQRRVAAGYDLTVVYVDGQHFGYLLDRSLFVGLDWRQSIGKKEVDEAWIPVEIPRALSNSLSSIMCDLGLRFGRIDLLANDLKCTQVWFLEVNPNGQWAWLDLNQENGLFDAVLDFLVSN